MRIHYKSILFLGATLFLQHSLAETVSSQNNDEPWVNVLTWWGYLDDPKIKEEVQDKCHVKLSYDEYYTNEQFLKMYGQSKQNYDIIIFSNLLYTGIKKEINNQNSNLWKASNNYYPYFKQYYLKHDYDHNVVFFTHSLMGFLYNPSLINIKSNQDVFQIFKDAGDNYTILVDDPAEVHNLLTLGYKSSAEKWPASIYNNAGEIKFNYDNFKRISQNSNIYVTNDFNNIYKLNNFAFSYMWSGDALLSLQQANKPYKFTLHPKLSYVCTDLLAQIKDSGPATCVARVLSSPKVMDIVENSSYYFTPYFKNTINTSDFNMLYSETKAILPTVQWIEPMTLDRFNQLDNQWQSIKLDLNNVEPTS